ncbi:MAG TPA: hypothetical protein PKJ64_12435, partial [bacterium]|nr:hypothetical protein [bacterium]
MVEWIVNGLWGLRSGEILSTKLLPSSHLWKCHSKSCHPFTYFLSQKIPGMAQKIFFYVLTVNTADLQNIYAFVFGSVHRVAGLDTKSFIKLDIIGKGPMTRCCDGACTSGRL